MTIDALKLTIKDAGEYTIQTEISLDGEPFKTETESFILKISVDDDKSLNETTTSNGNGTSNETSSSNGNETANETSSSNVTRQRTRLHPQMVMRHNYRIVKIR